MDPKLSLNCTNNLLNSGLDSISINIIETTRDSIEALKSASDKAAVAKERLNSERVTKAGIIIIFDN